MRRVLTIGAAVLALGLAPGLFADNPGPVPYVDMATAQTLIDTLTRENETLTADVQTQTQQLAALIEQLTVAKKGLDDLGPLMDEVQARISDLANLADELVDRGLRARAQTAMERNLAAKKKLMARMGDLGSFSASVPKQMEALQFQIAVDRAKINHNNDDIVLLQATIARTKIQEGRLNDLLARMDALLAKVDAVLAKGAVQK